MEQKEINNSLKGGCPVCEVKEGFLFRRERNIQRKQPKSLSNLSVVEFEPTSGWRESFECRNCGYENIVKDDRIPPQDFSIIELVESIYD